MKFVIAILMAVAIPAHAQSNAPSVTPGMTGDQLLAIMETGPLGKANVTGFVAGIYEAELDETICNQKPVAYGELRDELLIIMRRNPQLNKYSAGKLVHGNLMRMYPCAKLKGSI